MSKYRLNKKCPVCLVKLLDRNKSGFCNHHRDRSENNNPFYGKHHSQKTKEILKQKSVISSTLNWTNPEYREKVIKRVSKPRRENFKKEQSERILQWYKENPHQREIRSKKMKETWKKGAIVSSKSFQGNTSRVQQEFFTELSEICTGLKENSVIREGKRWYFPDIHILDIGVIIEFYGNYWHANPKMYKPEDIVNGMCAKDVWEKDRKRIEALEQIGYKTYVVWEDEYKKNKDQVLNGFDMFLNWESCAF